MKKVLTVLAIFIVTFAIIYVVYNEFKTKPIDANIVKPENILQDANTGLNNMLNEILNEEVEENLENIEEVQDNTEVSNVEANEQNIENNSKVEETEDTSSTPREKKAIDLVKKEWEKEWESLSGVTFNNVGIQSDGQYRVSVNDSRTTEVIQFYIVDVDTGIVKEK